MQDDLLIKYADDIWDGLIAPFAGIGVERKGRVAAQPVLPRIRPQTSRFEFSTQDMSPGHNATIF